MQINSSTRFRSAAVFLLFFFFLLSVLCLVAWYRTSYAVRSTFLATATLLVFFSNVRAWQILQQLAALLWSKFRRKRWTDRSHCVFFQPVNHTHSAETSFPPAYIEHATRAWHTNHVVAASADLILALRVVLRRAEVDNSPYPCYPGTYRPIDLIQPQCHWRGRWPQKSQCHTAFQILSPAGSMTRLFFLLTSFCSIW